MTLELVGAVISLVGVVLVLVAVWRGFRAGGMRLRHTGALARLAPEERRKAVRRIRAGGSPPRAAAMPHPVPVTDTGRLPHAQPTADDPATLRAVAESLAGQQWLVLTAAGIIVIQAGQALQHRSTVWLVASGVVAALMAAGIVLLVRDIRAARRFLNPSR